MIRKLAEELAYADGVTTTDTIRSREESSPPSKSDEGLLERCGFTDTARKAHERDSAGVLSDLLGGYGDAVGGHQNDIARHLGEHVRKITGSSAISQSAVWRSRKATGDK